MKTLVIEIIEVSEIVPESWNAWFWCLISENAPFSWGDNNRSLVCACDFRRHCEDRLIDASDEENVPQKEIDKFLELLDMLGAQYLDLEN